MTIDTSIYGNIQQYQAPSLLDSQQKAMSLGQLALQSAQAQRAFADQDAIRQAMASNVNPDGSLNRQAALSYLAKTSPTGFMQLQQHLAGMDKATADAQKSQADAYKERATIAANAIGYITKLPPQLQEQGYNDMVDHLVKTGVASPGQFPAYSPDVLQSLSVRAQQHMGQNTPEYLGSQKTKADTAEANAKTAESYAQIGKIKAETGEVMNKNVQALKDDLDPNKARGGNLAKSQAVINAADRLGAMFKQFPDYNIPKAQQAELVSAFGAILNGGSAPLQSQLEEMVPKSARGSASEMAAWVTNDPLGQGQQKFMKLLSESVERERDVAENQVKTAQVQRLSAHKFLRDKDPDTYWSVVHSYGIEPENIKDGKYVGGSQSAPPASGGTIRMRAPDGSVRVIPASMKGEAIAAGGKVIQ